MLEHDYFDTEILYHGQLNERTDDHLRGERDLLTSEASVQQAIEKIKKDCKETDTDSYKIMEIRDKKLETLRKQRTLLFVLNIPLALAIPLTLGLDLLPPGLIIE